MNDAAPPHAAAADSTIKPEPMQELRIAVTIPVPREAFAQAHSLVAAEPLLKHIADAVKPLGGSVMHDLVTPKPRGTAG